MKKESKDKEIKVIIGVPVSDTDAMRALTCQSIGGAIIGAGGIVIDMILRRSCDIVSNRTWLVNEAIKNGATHLLFVDSDMIFPSDTIPKLLAHKKEIVGATYNKREFPLKKVSKPLTEESETELYEAQHNGLGVTLIDLSIFKEEWVDPQNGRKVPFFNFGRDSQGALVMGEDVFFSMAAKDMGFKTWIDPVLSKKVRHIGEYCF